MGRGALEIFFGSKDATGWGTQTRGGRRKVQAISQKTAMRMSENGGLIRESVVKYKTQPFKN